MRVLCFKVGPYMRFVVRESVDTSRFVRFRLDIQHVNVSSDVREWTGLELELHPNFLVPAFRSPSLRRHYICGDYVWLSYEQCCTTIFYRGVIHACYKNGVMVYSVACRADDIIPFNCLFLGNWFELHERCREAIYMWLLCCKRLPIVRDVHKLIAFFVWSTRDEREWELDSDETIKNKKTKLQ